MPEELAVRIEDLSITYKINVDTKKTLKNAVMRASKGEKVRMRTVEAVKHMNLEIPHGSVLGIVGANVFKGYEGSSTCVLYYGANGNKYVAGTPTGYGSSYTANDVIGVALDCDGGTIVFYKNNTSQGSITLPSNTNGWKPLLSAPVAR